MRALALYISLSLVSLSAVSQRNENGKSHYEDLSALRPRFDPIVDSMNTPKAPKSTRDVAPELNVNSKVDAILDSIDRLNVLRKFVQGYTIQIYSGQNREDANNSKMKLLDELGMKADLQYLQPKFRVKVGSYFTILDAQRELWRLKRIFPNAFLVPESIPIK